MQQLRYSVSLLASFSWIDFVWNYLSISISVFSGHAPITLTSSQLFRLNIMSVIPSKLGALSIPIMLNACMISLYPIVIPFSHSVSFFAANSSNCSLIHSAFIMSIVLLSLTCSTSSHSLSPLCASFHYLIFAIGPLIMFSMPVHVLYLVNVCRLLCHCFGSYDIRGCVMLFAKYSSANLLRAFWVFFDVHSSKLLSI